VKTLAIALGILSFVLLITYLLAVRVEKASNTEYKQLNPFSEEDEGLMATDEPRTTQYGALEDIYEGQSDYSTSDEHNANVSPRGRHDLDNSITIQNERNSPEGEDEVSIRSKYAKLYEKYSLA